MEEKKLNTNDRCNNSFFVDYAATVAQNYVSAIIMTPMKQFVVFIHG